MGHPNKPTSEDIAKLPKWARTYIASLEANAKNLQAEKAALQAAMTAAGEGYQGLVTWSRLFEDFPLPDNADVHFNFGAPGRALRDYITVGFKASELERGKRILHIHGSGSLMIQPVASNAVSIRLASREEQ